MDSASRRYKSLVKYQVASAPAQQCHLLEIFFPRMLGTPTLLSPLTLLAMPSPLLCLFLSVHRRALRGACPILSPSPCTLFHLWRSHPYSDNSHFIPLVPTSHFNSQFNQPRNPANSAQHTLVTNAQLLGKLHVLETSLKLLVTTVKWKMPEHQAHFTASKWKGKHKRIREKTQSR